MPDRDWMLTERNRLAEQRNLFLRQMYMELGRLNGQIETYDALLKQMGDMAHGGVEAPPAPLGDQIVEVPESANGSTL